MAHYILNTDALVRNKEGAFGIYPEREKDPFYFYKKGEEKEATVYVSFKIENSVIILDLFGLETPKGLREIHLKIQVGNPETKFLKVTTNFDSQVNPGFFNKLWPGGPYSFILSLVILEEEILKNRKELPWLRDYLLNGGIGALAEKRMRYPKFFQDFKKLFE